MRYRKYMKVVAAAMLCMICVSGCNKRQPVNSPMNNLDNLTQTPGLTIQVTPTVAVEELNQQKELSIYSIDSQSSEVIAIPTMVSGDEKITPEVIVDKVVENIGDAVVNVGIDSVTTKDTAVIVSFLDDQPPVSDVDSSVEKEILDAIAQSLLDNLPEYDKVIFRVLGNAYQSEHISMGLDEVYMQYKK